MWIAPTLGGLTTRPMQSVLLLSCVLQIQVLNASQEKLLAAHKKQHQLKFKVEISTQRFAEVFLLGTFWEPWHAFSYNDAKGTLLPQPTRCTSPNVQGKRRHSSPAGCQVSQGGVNRSAIAPPKQHGVFQAFWRSHLPDFTTLHQGIVRSKPPQEQAWLCYDSFMVCFMSLKNPRPLLGSPQNSPQKKNIAGLRNCCGCWGLPPRSPPHWKPKALAPLDCSPRRRASATKYENESNGQNGRKALWNHIEINDFPVGLKKTTCWKFSVKESNIINVWILQQKLWNYLGEASTLRSRSPLKWLLHQRRVMSSFHEHPHEGCSRSLLRGKFLTFFPWEPHGVKATLRECDRKINISMSEGQQPLRGPFLRHFLGNPEVRSDQSKKNMAFGGALAKDSKVRSSILSDRPVQAAKWQPGPQNTYRVDTEYNI